MDDHATAISRSRTADNANNLAAAFLAEMRRRYGDTALGQQELEGQIVEGRMTGLWKRSYLDQSRLLARPELTRIVVAVDPPVTATAGSDSCGIVIAGLGVDKRGYVIGVSEHPLLDLIARPNPICSAPDLLESWYGFLLVSGNAYLEAVALGGTLRELHALRPDRMKVIPGPDGWPEAFEYTAGGRAVRFAGEVVPGVRPILHVKLFHPTNDHYGLSPIEAAATAIDIHNTASRWNKALLDNSARPSGALVYTSRDGNLTVEQYDRLKAELEQGFQGAAHAGRPLLLEGGLDWKSMSLTPKDMDFIEAKHVAAREIALALGVPPMLLGIPGDNTYSNYQEATRSFWRQTVLPLVNRTAKALSQWLSPAFGGLFELRPDLDAIEALSPEREALWTRVDKATFLTPDEKRAAVGYGPLDAESPSPSRWKRAFGTTRGGVRGGGNRDHPSGLPSDAKYSPDQPRLPAGQSGGGQWTSGESGEGAGRDEQPASTVGGGPIRLAQVGGASTMTDTGSRTSRTVLGAFIQAPAGQTVWSFIVGPLTNNVYQTPFGPVDVTGWTAYYGPPGSTLGGQTYPDGVLRFVDPAETRAHTVPVAPGM